MKKNLKWKTIFCFIIISIFSLSMFSLRKKNKKPNIVYILADDLGYGDISINNPDGKITTPNIDKLASQGMRFTDAHSPSSVCTPTRYGLLTGRYPWRSRLPVGVLKGYSRTLIENELPTVASFLKSEGYQTGVIGKWHLGLDWQLQPAYQKLENDKLYGISEEMSADVIDFSKDPPKGPNTAGFNYSFILPASLDMPPYCYLENQKLVDKPDAYTEGNKLTTGYTGAFWRAGKMAPSFDFYKVLPTFIDKAVAFLKNQSTEKPFFLYLPLGAPHTPWVPEKSYQGKSKVGEYGDFVQQVDASVGEIIKTLKAKKLDQNTIVILASDNGPYWRQNFVETFNHKAAGELRGMKADIFEAGHRIPFIVKWPGKVKPNSVSSATTCLTNLMATCTDILKNSDPKYLTEDSYSILPVLVGKSQKVTNQQAIVHSSSMGFYAIRKGDWKLIEGLGSGGFTEPKEIKPLNSQANGQLFNIAEDIAEKNDVFTRNPAKVKELHDMLEDIKMTKRKPF